MKKSFFTLAAFLVGVVVGSAAHESIDLAAIYFLLNIFFN